MTDMPNSYVKFLFDEITGLNINAGFVDTMTLVFFLLALAVSIIMNVRDRNKEA